MPRFYYQPVEFEGNQMKKFLLATPTQGCFGVLLSVMFFAAVMVPPLQAASGDGRIRVVSSAPDQVSGGDARIEISTRGNALNDRTASITVLVNGADQSDKFAAIDKTTLSGVVDGLNPGVNTIAFTEVRSMGKGRAASVPVRSR